MVTNDDREAELGSVSALYAGFQAWAARAPGAVAVVEPKFRGPFVHYLETTFAELSARIDSYRGGLVKMGLRPNDRVLMLAPPSADFIAMAYAVFGAGATAVFIDPGIGRRALFDCITRSNPAALFGVARAQLLRWFNLMPGLRLAVTAGRGLRIGGPNLRDLAKTGAATPAPVAKPAATPVIAFTSGATGLPKGVVFSDAMFRAVMLLFREVLVLHAGERALPLLPIFSLLLPAGGITTVIPPLDPKHPLALSPRRVLRVHRDLDVRYAFGSPTIWNRIAGYAQRSKEDLRPLERIYMAGAPVSKALVERVQGVMPGGQVYVPYGATEALLVSLAAADQIVGSTSVHAVGGELGTLIGKPVGGIEARVVHIREGEPAAIEELPALEIGEVIVRGAVVSASYLDDPGADRVAKLMCGDGLWHRMGDMAYKDADGNLYFCGRQAHLISRAMRTYYSVPTERIFNAHPAVRRSALIDLGPGRAPGVAVEPNRWPATHRRRHELVKELRALAATDPITCELEDFFLHPDFPVDARHNAKIFRDRLGHWARGVSSRQRARWTR